jgi:hypothetical protein
VHQHRGECHEYRASRLPQREAMAIGLDGSTLDRGGHAGSRKRLPTIEGAQATSGAPHRSASTSNQKLNSRRPCSSSQRRVTSTSAAAASQCSTKSGTSPNFILPLIEIHNRKRSYAVSIITAGIKLIGRDSGPVRPPLTNLTEGEITELSALCREATSEGREAGVQFRARS